MVQLSRKKPFDHWCFMPVFELGSQGFATLPLGDTIIPFRRVLLYFFDPCYVKQIDLNKGEIMPQQKTINSSNSSLSILNPNCAGIDIGSRSHFVAVPKDRCEDNVREFQTFTVDLKELVRWLKKCGIDTVVMESTGVYWIPIFEILDQQGFQVLLVNAKHVKNVSAHKTDVLDCQWLQQLGSYGLLKGAFRPEDTIVELRAYIRHRSTLIQSAATYVQRMQKALMQMNIQLHHVIADITGQTGMKIIRAIVQGERNSTKLAAFRNERCHNSEEVIKKSLEGNYRSEHLFSLKQALELYDFFHKQIAECEEEIKKNLACCQTN